jgi:hypothetical protein
MTNELGKSDSPAVLAENSGRATAISLSMFALPSTPKIPPVLQDMKSLTST